MFSGLSNQKPTNAMATTSPFDPDKLDSDFYSKDPNQHGDSDFGTPSEGVGTNAYKDSTSGMDMETGNLETTKATREEHKFEGNQATPTGENYQTSQEWDVNADTVAESAQPQKGKMMSDEAAKKLDEIAENPSDDALFHRADATYLEQGDNPNEGYDSHGQGYDDKNKVDSQ